MSSDADLASRPGRRSDTATRRVPTPARRVVALCGGVGGAKLVDGLAAVLPAAALTVVVNTGDDFRHYGLYIAPDVDTVLYTLAGVADPKTGWGIADDTDRVMRALRERGDAAWFHLGDRDLATHLVRTAALADGATPTAITRRLATALGVGTSVLPMTDGRVATEVETAQGVLPFQEWFVRRRCQPPARGVRYVGIEDARPSEAVLDALTAATHVVICPSNPYLSIGPILALGDLRARLAALDAPVVAVSPIIGRQAVKGPTAEMMTTLAGEPSSTAVARQYRDVIDGLVIDRADAEERAAITALGPRVTVTATLMRNRQDRVRLARETLAFAEQLDGSTPTRSSS